MGQLLQETKIAIFKIGGILSKFYSNEMGLSVSPILWELVAKICEK